jgi:hypothetical protein
MRRLCRNSAITTHQRAGHQRGVEKYKKSHQRGVKNIKKAINAVLKKYKRLTWQGGAGGGGVVSKQLIK